MLVISQHARLAHIPIPRDAVLRVNVAWVKNNEDLTNLLNGIRHDVFLDFPEGRKKPPTPVLKFLDLLEAMRRFNVIKYFALSNVQHPETIDKMLKLIPSTIEIVPKIESLIGVKNLGKIVARLPYPKRYIMLDKEDLYTDLKSNNSKLEKCVRGVRQQCKRRHVEVLELAGVIFLTHEE
jgi:hypothetical protein